jgi:hypothetical protein
MTYIYLLELNPKKMESKSPPLFFFQFFSNIQTHSRDLTVHCMMKKKGTVSNALYIQA